jgi:predicted ATP-binding protein involved in virulence
MLALVEQFARLDQAIERLKNKGLRKILLFVDEGDAFLHLEWQRKYVDLLNGYLGQCAARHELESLQVVLATHSPILAGDVPSSMIQSLDQDQLRFKTFGATLDDIILRSFLSNSIGEFAAKHVRRLHAAVANGNLSDEDHLLLEQIGDPVLKREVLSDRRGNHDR